MNGAQSLVKMLVDSDVGVCFANPGTSEMHFVAALDQTPGIRCVLCLAEGIVTGAADGYYRMSGKPGVTLLHLGPGLGNGLANLHNARKARSAIVNIVGDHATYHVEFDAPLTADVEGIARPVSHWVRTCQSADEVADCATDALEVAASYPGHISTLILPANTAWNECGDNKITGANVRSSSDNAVEHSSSNRSGEATSTESTLKAPAIASQQQVDKVAKLIGSQDASVLILTGNCLEERGLHAASQIRQATGAQFLAQTSNARLPRGEGRVSISAVPYAVDEALKVLEPYKNVVPVCAKAPVAFFAYPDKPSTLSPGTANIVKLALETEDGAAALQSLAEALGADQLAPELQEYDVPALPGKVKLDGEVIASVVANTLPTDSIVIDESISIGRAFSGPTRGARAHDWLQICGGSIGDGFPLATGAAVACPDRKVIALQADGSGMYTLQALWTQARENLDITTVVLSNRAYAILKHELTNVGAAELAGQTANDLMELQRPELDWIALAKGMGVPGVSVEDADELYNQLLAAIAHPGPFLIEAKIQ